MASSSSTFNFQVPGQVADDVKVFIVTIENREIHKPHLYSTPPRLVGMTASEFRKYFTTAEESITICYLSRFDRYRNVTDRQTDGQNCYISIAIKTFAMYNEFDLDDYNCIHCN